MFQPSDALPPLPIEHYIESLGATEPVPEDAVAACVARYPEACLHRRPMSQS